MKEKQLTEQRLRQHGAAGKAKAYITKMCAQCSTLQPTHMFRRWRGTKVFTFTVCSLCHPEKTIKELTDNQLQTYITARQLSVEDTRELWAQRDQRRFEARSERVSKTMTDKWRKDRKLLWRPVWLLINEELRRNQPNANPPINSRTGIPQRTTPELQAFANLYMDHINDLKVRIITSINTNGTSTVRILHTQTGTDDKGAPIISTVTLADPKDWGMLLDSSVLRELAEAFAEVGKAWLRQGRVPKFREPDFLRALAK